MKDALVASGLTLVLLTSIPAPAAPAAEPAVSSQRLPGLLHSVRVRTDALGVPHVFAVTDRDALFALGYLHARDRLFQMDLLRRRFDGTLAELLGGGALASDVQFRTLGLRRAAEASLPALSVVTRVWLQSYARGVNRFLAENPLPPEYGALGLTSVRPWRPVDSVVVGKGLAFGLSFDLSDIDRTVALRTFQAAGEEAGFDGTALFSQDLYRSAPFDPTVSIPAALGSSAAVAEATGHLDERTLELARSYRDRVSEVPALARTLQPQWHRRGSNWWIVSGEKTESGHPILANDPHLGLDSPAVFYEAQIRIDPRQGRPAMNAFGVTFPGAPGIILGCNPWICWGATTNPMDVTDVFQEELVVDPETGLPVATRFEDGTEPLVAIPQTFRVNTPGDGEPDNLEVADVPPTEGGVTLIVPRRNDGPIVAVDASDPDAVTGLSVQYTGWGATRELDTFRTWNRARDLDGFRRGLQFFDVGSQNFAYADVEGNIAYFTSAEMPLREDLQLLNAPDGGVPPWIIRDGTHALRHEWLPAEPTEPGPDQARSLPYRILPFDEMPQVVNPEAGFVLNANNDPVGTVLDNDPLNQLRPGGGLYYLSPGYAQGFRAGRIRRLIEGALAGGGTLSLDEIAAFQANNELLDAEVLVPHIVQAFENAGAGGAPPELAALAADPEVAEAVDRLAAWGFATPTGIPEGFDPGDDPADLPAPSPEEVEASVAATIYSAWRGQAVQRVIDGALAPLGIEGQAPGSSVAMAALRHHLEAVEESGGLGASGLPFFAHPAASTPAEARDLALLESLRSALDLLASDTFAPAFGGSTDQEDYRWGRLHRIVFDHPLGGPFSIPEGGGLASVSPELPGIARAGGFGAVDASSHGARADGPNEFTFGSGPARRFVGELTPQGPLPPLEVIPGGQSGIPGHPFFGTQLPLWLTNDYHVFPYRPDDVVQGTARFEVFVP
ncbi:MAG: penicillin acylase family protein [Thermoanaerobaculia bacterium]